MGAPTAAPSRRWGPTRVRSTPTGCDGPPVPPTRDRPARAPRVPATPEHRRTVDEPDDALTIVEHLVALAVSTAIGLTTWTWLAAAPNATGLFSVAVAVAAVALGPLLPSSPVPIGAGLTLGPLLVSPWTTPGATATGCGSWSSRCWAGSVSRRRLQHHGDGAARLDQRVALRAPPPRGHSTGSAAEGTRDSLPRSGGDRPCPCERRQGAPVGGRPFVCKFGSSRRCFGFVGRARRCSISSRSARSSSRLFASAWARERQSSTLASRPSTIRWRSAWRSSAARSAASARARSRFNRVTSRSFSAIVLRSARSSFRSRSGSARSAASRSR